MPRLLLYIGLPASTVTILRAVWSYLSARTRRSKPQLARRVTAGGDWLRNLFFSWLRPLARRRWVRTHVLKRYCRNLARNHELLTIPGRGVPLPIDECFTPLELRAGQLSEGTQLLTRRGVVLVLGDPGSGKSALMSRLVRTLCEQAVQDHTRARLPIYAPIFQMMPVLRNWAREQRASALTREVTINPQESFDLLASWFYQSWVAPLRAHDVDDLLEALASQPSAGAVIVLDGLDELDAEDLPLVEAFVVSLTAHIQALPGQNLLIITSRRQALDFTPSLCDGTIAGLDTLFLQPYSPAAIYSFLQRWPYRAGLDSTSEAQRIFKDLRQNPTLIESCTNPLFLTLYVSRDQRLRNSGDLDYGDKPETRAEFFSDVVGFLIALRRPRREGVAAPIVAVRRARHKFFVDLAREHIEGTDTPNQIDHAIVIRHASSLAQTESERTAEGAVMRLAKDSGIFLQNADSTWSFIHSSFLYYFVGETIATTADTKRQIDRLLGLLKRKPLRYVEGFYMACGLMAWRGWPALGTILDRIGNNSEVFDLYPRACLEAQTYDRPDFPAVIRQLCRRWKQDESQEGLLKDLVSVLLDYQRFCETMGQEPVVSYDGQLREAIGSSPRASFSGANVGVEIALRLANEGSLVTVLEGAPVEEAVVALYEPALVRGLDVEEAARQPRVAAVICEAALRSSLLAGALGTRSRFRLTREGEGWTDSWSIRGSQLALLLTSALPYVRGLEVSQKAAFPHLFLLSSTRPIRRLRYELLFGEWRVMALVASVSFVVGFSLIAVGVSVLPTVVAVAISLAIGFALARAAVLKGRLRLASVRLLNQDPARPDVGGSLGRRVTQVRGRRSELPRWSVGRHPQSREGRSYAVYDRVVPLMWRRFCPAAGDARISLTAGASVQQFWTEDVRRLVRSGV